MFSSPLGVPIHPRGFFGDHGQLRPAGNHEPEVTATFADHIAGKRNPGVDIGTGRCGDTLYAMGGGVISTAGLIGFPVANALTVRIRVGDYEPAVTHMASIAVNPRTRAKWKVKDVVNRGEVIGTLGTTGASACHCHMGMKQRINGVWTEIDGWSLLDQNQTQEDTAMPGFKAASPPIGRFTFVGVHALVSPADPKVHYLQAPGAAFDVLVALDLKRPDGQPVDIEGNSPPLNQRDQVYLVDAPTFGVAAYALRQDGTFTPAKPDDTALLKARQGGIQAARDALAALK